MDATTYNCKPRAIVLTSDEQTLQDIARLDFTFGMAYIGHAYDRTATLTAKAADNHGDPLSENNTPADPFRARSPPNPPGYNVLLTGF